MCTSGILIISGNRVLGPVLLIFEMEFLIVIQDNPFIVEYLKPKRKMNAFSLGNVVNNIRWTDIASHFSVIGIAVLMLASNYHREPKKSKTDLIL